MNQIIFLWAHPRSMSTAIEPIMRERGDLKCLHEPFLHYYYLQKTTRHLAHFDAEQDHPVSYQETRDSIMKMARATAVFARDMSYYVMPEILQEVEFCECVQHCFLIRNPLRSILSYYRLDPDLSLDEVGIEAQWRHYHGLEKIGQIPIVLEAEAVQAGSRATMSLFWQALGLDFRDEAFNWDRDFSPEDWQYVKVWHQKVSDSQGIQPVKQGDELELRAKFDQIAGQAPRLQEYLNHHWPFYEKLKSRSLTSDND